MAPVSRSEFDERFADSNEIYMRSVMHYESYLWSLMVMMEVEWVILIEREIDQGTADLDRTRFPIIMNLGQPNRD